MSVDPKRWFAEYDAFLKVEEITVPSELTEKVFFTMRKSLTPSPWIVFSKILGIHSVTGSMSLAVCHQFGMNPFGTAMSLDDWFMAMWGHATCMVICGVLFVGLTCLIAGYLLSVEEIRSLKNTGLAQILALGTVSLTVFALFGTQFAPVMAGLWLLGALLGGFLATEFVWQARRLALE